MLWTGQTAFETRAAPVLSEQRHRSLTVYDTSTESVYVLVLIRLATQTSPVGNTSLGHLLAFRHMRTCYFDSRR